MSYRILGQLSPSALTTETLYQVPTDKSTVVTLLTVCNQTSSPINYRISVNKASESGSTLTKQYLYYDIPLDANDTFNSSLNGIGLSSGDSIKVYSSASGVSFNAFGQEI